jgi:hypothetical protein
MSVRPTLLVGASVFAALALFLVWLFGVQAFVMWEARNVGRKAPGVWATPVPLTDTTVSQPQGAPVSYCGYTFNIPWTDLNTGRSGPSDGSTAFLVFRSNHAVVLMTSPANVLVDSMSNSAPGRRNRDIVFGAEMPRTDYEFKLAALSLTPARFAWFTPKREAIRDFILLMSKAMDMQPKSGADIFRFETPQFRGFQIGKPGTAAQIVQLELYSRDAQLKFIFGEPQASPPTVSQADINLIVHTIRPATEGASPTPKP